MAGTRILTRALVAVGLVLVAGCRDDGETTTATGLALGSTTTEVAEGGVDSTTTSVTSTSTTTTSTTTTTTPDPRVETVATACEAFLGTNLRSVGTDATVDDATYAAALEALVAGGPEPTPGAAASVLALEDANDAVAAGTLSYEEAAGALQDAYDAGEVLHHWGLDTCPVEGVVWSCSLTSTQRYAPPGDSTDGGGEATTTVPGAARPEDVFGEAATEGEPVEISRTDAEVVVAWLDGEGHAVEVLTVVDDAGWRPDRRQACNTDPMGIPPGEFTIVGEEIAD